MSFHWSTLQLTEFFSVVSDTEDEATALQRAVERATEALEAEVGVVVVDGQVRAAWGLGPDTAGRDVLGSVGTPRVVTLPALGEVHAVAAHLGRGTADVLVVARLDTPLEGQERQLLQAMAQLLGLVLRNVRALATERALREAREREATERLRLLEEVRARQRLLETMLAIQGAVSARHPLPEVLDAVTAGAAALLDGARVVLVVADPFADDGLALASSSGPNATGMSAPDREGSPERTAVLLAAKAAIAARSVVTHGPEQTTGYGRQPAPDPVPGPVVELVAAPVFAGGEVAGSLVAVLGAPAGGAGGAAAGGAQRRDLLAAFAQQASLALTDARTVEAVAQANHDPVTGLPNRALFLERLRAALAVRREDIVLFIDLDRFKAVNDSLGHRAGDELLAAVSHRIRSCLRAEDTAARIGGDEFAVLLHNVPQATGVAVAERVIELLRKPFRVAARDVVIGASVGLADSRCAEDGADELLSNADVAMYKAKKRGASQIAVFEPRMLAETVERLDLLADLQRALHRGDFRLNYQPLVELRHGRPVGTEGLVRWTDARRGVVPPMAFIPIAEESGLIVDIGRWVLEEGTRQLAAWRRAGLPALTLNLNISARQLVDRDFVAHVRHVLAASGLPAGVLTLELTETALMSDPEASAHQMRQLKALGVRLAVDDFGTGYSSLSYLRRFPVDQVKIDRAFVAQLNAGSEDLAVVRTVIELGRALRLETVAEGIEEAAQATTLRRLGCHLGQGYHLARPMEADAVAGYLRGRAGSGRRRPDDYARLLEVMECGGSDVA